MHKTPLFTYWRSDLSASLVVALVALPLCLGIALASGAPLFAGLIAGIVGGIVVGAVSRSPLSVSGPAAGLTVIVFTALQTLTYEQFLLATCLAGAMQIVFGTLRAGVIADFIPSAVVKGMLAAIGLILIMKQIPHAVGWDSADYHGSESFRQSDGGNTFSALGQVAEHITPLAFLLAVASLAFLFWWDKKQPKLRSFLRYLPGPLVVVAAGVAANMLMLSVVPEAAIGPGHLVAVPVADSFGSFLGQFRLPAFAAIGEKAVWTTAITLALVASIESLLSIEAIDRLDPMKRVTPTSRELVAQGVGNLVSGAIGGLPVTSVIVRSSANVTAGAKSRLSAITHGLLLLACIVTIPTLLNKIPLASLAAILLQVGYKLTKPSIYREEYQKGLAYIIPFVVTVGAILLTDLLVGIGIGVVVGLGFVLSQNLRSSIMLVADEENYLVRCKKDLFFIHKYELKQKLDRIPDGSKVLIDLTRVNYIDLDNIEILKNFMASAAFRRITVQVKKSEDARIAPLVEEVQHEAA